MSIVLVFLVCHFPRILLSIHEMWIIEDTLKCSKARLPVSDIETGTSGTANNVENRKKER